MTHESQIMSAAGGPPPAADMVWIPSGTFTMGSDKHYREEAPARDVSVDGFWISRTPTTNAQFAEFVEATGYVTVAERPLDPADYPGAPIENLVPGSMVFVPTSGPVDLRHLSQWWVWTPGASWRHPEGHRSTIADRQQHPVVHVSAEDAEAYVGWRGLALPTEAQWERAARGEFNGSAYTWGEDPESSELRRANYYHGAFPYRAEPGYGATTAVGTFPANDFGLVDMAGNVWEWTCDWYVENRFADSDSCCIPSNPRGGTEQDSLDPNQPQFGIPRRVIKGGSFLCADEYCMRYRPAARRPQPIDTGMSHIGFRCAYRLDNSDG